MSSLIETEFAIIERFNGYLKCAYKNGVHIRLDVAEQCIQDRIDFSEGKSFPMLIDGRGISGIDKDARDLLSSEKGRVGVLAAAILTDSVFTTFMANFFLTVTLVRPKLPTKLFTNEEKAIEWLEGYKEPKQ